jgi:hypothetical protein
MIDKATLKSYFRRGSVPSEQNFADLIDSFASIGVSGPTWIVNQETERLALTPTIPEDIYKFCYQTDRNALFIYMGFDEEAGHMWVPVIDTDVMRMSVFDTDYNGAVDLADYVREPLSLEFDAHINGLTVGKGAGSWDGNVVLGVGALVNPIAIGVYQPNGNIAIGDGALADITCGSINTAVGYCALGSCMDGRDNTAIGYYALAYNLVNGMRNSALGCSSLLGANGDDNIGIGYRAGATCSPEPTVFLPTFPKRSIYIGNYALGTEGDINAIAIGYEAVSEGPNTTVIGNSDTLLTKLFGVITTPGDRLRIGSAFTPSSASSSGTAGDICWDANYIYVCIATDTWKRTAISTW